MSQTLKQNTVINEEYVVEKLIATGGMNSQIYRVHNVHDVNDIKALKVVEKTDDISDEFWTKFYDECVTALRVNGKDNLVQTYEIFQENGGNTICILMEYINGLSLRDYINKCGTLNPYLALNIFQEILIGVDQLHSFKQQIIHRDLKPENILLSKDLIQVKIIDFGISSVIEKINCTINVVQKRCLTYENQFFGTYPYICPDILKKSKNNNENYKIITVQFDFFSLGIILYEMIMGCKPFWSDDYNRSEIISLPMKYDLPNMTKINPNITTEIENIIFKCLASKDDDLAYRYNSINEIIDDVIKAKDKINFHGDHDPLLKSPNLRIYQTPTVFNIEAQKLKLKFYEQWYFFWAILITFIVFIIVTFIVIFVIVK